MPVRAEGYIGDGGFTGDGLRPLRGTLATLFLRGYIFSPPVIPSKAVAHRVPSIPPIKKSIPQLRNALVVNYARCVVLLVHNLGLAVNTLDMDGIEYGAQEVLAQC